MDWRCEIRYKPQLFKCVPVEYCYRPGEIAVGPEYFQTYATKEECERNLAKGTKNLLFFSGLVGLGILIIALLLKD